MALPPLWRSARERGELLPSREISEPFASLRRDMERMFEDFARDFGWGPPAAAAVGMAPRVDVSETDSEIKIEAELPGVDQNDVEVVLSEGRLTIKGEKKQEKEEEKKGYHMVERSYGSFARSIALPFEADPDKVKATFAKGVLTITVPKPPAVWATEKRIAITGREWHAHPPRHQPGRVQARASALSPLGVSSARQGDAPTTQPAGPTTTDYCRRNSGEV